MVNGPRELSDRQRLHDRLGPFRSFCIELRTASACVVSPPPERAHLSRILCTDAGHLQQHHQGVGTQFPERSRQAGSASVLPVPSGCAQSRPRCATAPARHVGAQAFLFQIIGAVGFGLGGGQGQVEEAHRHDLAELRVGDAHENANRFLYLSSFVSSWRKLLRGYRLGMAFN